MIPTKVWDGATAGGASSPVTCDGSTVFALIQGAGAVVDPIKIDTFPGMTLRWFRLSGTITLQWGFNSQWDSFQDAALSISYADGVAIDAWFVE